MSDKQNIEDTEWFDTSQLTTDVELDTEFFERVRKGESSKKIIPHMFDILRKEKLCV